MLLSATRPMSSLIGDFVDGKISAAKIKADYGIDIAQAAAAAVRPERR